jgi:recombination protein RecA
MIEKKKELETVFQHIEKQFGKGSVMWLSQDIVVPVEVVSSGSIMLNKALGIGGIPRGRVTEIYGPESSGKTTLALHIVAETQKLGGLACYIDTEHALDPFYAKDIGVDVDNMIISQPSTAEEALEIADSFVRSGLIDVIVLDSVAALVPKAEIDGEMGDSHMGLQARLMSQAMRKLTGHISKTNTIVIFINQIRSKIGVFFGNPETTTGGNALKFYASIRLDIRRTATLKDSATKAFGNRTKVKVVKNKLSPPFREAEFDIIYGIGISRINEIFEIGLQNGIIAKKGSWYNYGETVLGQGNKAIEYIEQHQEVVDAILKSMSEERQE